MNVSQNLIMQPSKGLHNQVVKIVVPYYTLPSFTYCAIFWGTKTVSRMQCRAQPSHAAMKPSMYFPFVSRNGFCFFKGTVQRDGSDQNQVHSIDLYYFLEKSARPPSSESPLTQGRHLVQLLPIMHSIAKCAVRRTPL